ncbi:MAG TPA: LysM domain-containing protein [Verrucomicrobiae bacterium]|nr:LysM domain-containing protein [Verrucomicrobiae bacterium]
MPFRSRFPQAFGPAPAPLAPGVPALPPGGLVTLDTDPPGMLNMDMGPYPAPLGMEGEMMHEMHEMHQKIHVVLRGQTVYTISRMYNVDMQAIIQANNLRYPDVIYPGQRLVIPDGLSYSNY